MTIEYIKELKDRVYELEGLLELAQLREDKLNDLAPLIEARLRTLAQGEAPVSVAEAQCSDFIEEPSYVVADFECEKPIESYDEPDEETEIEESDAEEYEEEMEQDLIAEEKDDAVEEDEAEVIEDEVATEPNPEPVAVAPTRRSETLLRRPAFNLNDRFRFRRELFCNSDTEFTEAIDLVAAMRSYDEAADYFYHEMGWDPKNPEVEDFMEIIKIHFDS